MDIEEVERLEKVTLAAKADELRLVDADAYLTFMKEAETAMPALLLEVRRLRGEIEALENARLARTEHELAKRGRSESMWLPKGWVWDDVAKEAHALIGPDRGFPGHMTITVTFQPGERPDR